MFEAIEILSCLGDFLQFKALMLQKKSELENAGGSGLTIVDKGVIEVENVEEYMERLTKLREEAKDADGWDQLLDDPMAAGWTMQNEQGDTLLRMTIKVDLKSHEMFEAFFNTTQDCLNWKPMKRLEEVEIFNENEKLIRMSPDVSWAVKSLAGIPEWIAVRIVARRHWPEENNFAFAIIPWDAEANKAVNQIGPVQVSSGVVMPDPDDPNKSIVTKLDKGNLKYMPRFAIKMIMNNKVIPTVTTMIADFKKSKTYKDMQ